MIPDPDQTIPAPITTKYRYRWLWVLLESLLARAKAERVLMLRDTLHSSPNWEISEQTEEKAVFD